MSEIKVGDWVEVVEVDEIDGRKGIKVGDMYKVVCSKLVGRKGAVVVSSNSSDILYPNQIKKAEPPVESLEKKELRMIDELKSEQIAPSFTDLANELTTKLRETLIAKNADYGDSFAKSYEKHGLVSAVIRLEDKLNRLESLVENDAKVNESIDDTLLDIAGYAILTLIARDSE